MYTLPYSYYYYAHSRIKVLCFFRIRDLLFQVIPRLLSSADSCNWSRWLRGSGGLDFGSKLHPHFDIIAIMHLLLLDDRLTRGVFGTQSMPLINRTYEL